MDPSTHGNGSPESEHTRTPTNRKPNADNLADIKVQNKIEEEASYLSSSSSDTSSDDDDDFFQIDPFKLDSSIRPNDMPKDDFYRSPHLDTLPQEVATSPSRNEVKDVSQAEIVISDLVGSDKSNPSSSPFSPPGVSEADTSGMYSSKQSPPVQIMGRSDVPDPKRIPSSVFARTKSTTPMEWSVASNESLFSIHMGRSGDLTSFYANQFEGYPPFPPAYSPGPVFNAVSANDSQQPPPPLPPLSPPQRQHQPQEHYQYQQTNAVEAANAEAMKDFIRATAALNAEKTSIEGMPHSETAGRLSDSSVNSYQSFAFPILTGDVRNISLKTNSMHEQARKEQRQQSELQTETPKAPDAPPVPSPIQAEQRGKWFPCFPCRPTCC